MKILFLLLLASSVHAANFSITYSDPNCANFGIAGSNNAFTVSCATTPVPPQPPQPWPPNCAGFSGGTRAIDMGFPASGVSFYTTTYGGFGPNQALVIRLAPPKGYVSIPNQAGSISMAEYGDPLTTRYAVLSTSACDFNGTSPYNVPALQIGSTISWSLQLARKDSTPLVNLTPGVLYYLNVRNTSQNGTNSCYTPTCNMIINWIRPPITAGTASKAKK